MTEFPCAEAVLAAASLENHIRPFVKSIKKIRSEQYLISMGGLSYLVNVGAGGSYRRDQMALEAETVPPGTIRETWFTSGGDNRVYYRKQFVAGGEWADVPPICFPAPPQSTENKHDSRGRFIQDRSGDGFVYFIVDDNSGMVKIGVSKNIRARLHELQTSHHHDLRLAHSIPTRKMFHDEKVLHRKFGKYRIRGEWFSFNEKIMAWIERDKKISTKNRKSITPHEKR